MDSLEFKKRHKESHFYKYAKVSTARHVLKEGNFLAQSPLNFNDPFDVQTGMHFDFDVTQFHEMMFNRIVELVEAEEDPIIVNLRSMAPTILRLREVHKAGLLSKTKLKTETKSVFDQLADKLESDRRRFSESRLALVKRMRVLCLSTTPDNLLMWSHYAEDHKGVVIKLKVAETAADDDPLWLAEEVAYSPTAPPLMSKREILDISFGLKEYDREDQRRRLALVKFDVWHYEKEFRFWDVVHETNQTKYTIGIAPQRIEAVYFGVKADPNEIQEIMQMGLTLNKNMVFYAARKHHSKFQIDFDKVSRE